MQLMGGFWSPIKILFLLPIIMDIIVLQAQAKNTDRKIFGGVFLRPMIPFSESLLKNTNGRSGRRLTHHRVHRQHGDIMKELAIDAGNGRVKHKMYDYAGNKQVKRKLLDQTNNQQFSIPQRSDGRLKPFGESLTNDVIGDSSFNVVVFPVKRLQTFGRRIQPIKDLHGGGGPPPVKVGWKEETSYGSWPAQMGALPYIPISPGVHRGGGSARAAADQMSQWGGHDKKPMRYG